MIIVSVSLLSARTGKTTELARMHIANDGMGDATHGNYDGWTYVGRSREALDRRQVSKHARIENFPRQRLHIWNLVARMLNNMGYTK